MGERYKKKFVCVQFVRFGRLAKYYKCRPSEYIRGLNDFEAFLFDEACLVAVEADNRLQEAKRKKEAAEEKDKKQFQKDMEDIFAGDDT